MPITHSSDEIGTDRVTLSASVIYWTLFVRELDVDSKTRKLTRRQMILASLGALAAGCNDTPVVMQKRPRPSWPTQMPQPRQDYTTAYQRPLPLPPRQTTQAYTPPVQTYTPAPQPAVAYQAPTPRPVAPSYNQPIIIKRNAWAKMATRTDRVDKMNGISRITLHHEGWHTVNFTDTNTTIARLQHIQKFHMKERGWGDVGYHYIVDRAGRVWEARPIKYQGAHVSNQNEHNVGIMLLGNFEKQSPSNIQLASSQLLIGNLMSSYSVPVHRVYTHQELNPTQCPGRYLQPRLVAMRQSGYLG